MTRVALSADNGQPIEATPRGRLTPAERRELMERQADRCASCDASLVLAGTPLRILAPMIDEHLIPLALGGSNDLRNRALYCIGCAKAKTAKDLGDIAKAKRLAFKHGGGRKPTAGQIRSRGFQKFNYPDFGDPA
jgi:5-methylcytosine-specific restriction endonuclease McrA